MTPPPGYVHLTCPDPPLDITVRLGPEPVKYTSGFSGWSVIERPGQTSMTIWNGTEPYLLQVGLMFDGFATDRRVWPELNALYHVARGDGESPAGILTVDGIPLPQPEWVIESIEMGDPIRDAKMFATRHPAVLQLRQYVPPEFANLRKRALAPAKGKTKIVKAKKGVTPAKIAKRFHCKWHELRGRNGLTLRKANQEIKAGTPIRVPVRQQHRQRQGGVRGKKRHKRD